MEEQKNMLVNEEALRMMDDWNAYHKLLTENLSPCIDECHSLGFAITTPSDLYHYESIKILVPVLLRHLQDQHYFVASRKQIGRSLEGAKRGELVPHFNELLQMYETEPAETDPDREGVRWVIGCLLAKAAKGKVAFEKIEELLFDKSYGSDRMSLLSCVRRMPKEQKVRVKEKIMQDQLLRENINRR